MLNAIGFLETLGSNPTMSAADYEAAVALLDADEAQHHALLLRDHAALNDLLGGRTARMMMSLYSPGEQPFKEDDDQREGDQPVEDPTPDEKKPQ